MGAHSKEIHLLESIRQGDLQTVVKVLNKNVKHLTAAGATTNRFLFKTTTNSKDGTLSHKHSSL